MALLDRLKERVESDLSDTELALMLDEALTTIEDLFGPPADPIFPVSVTVGGRTRTISLPRPMDASYPATITERYGAYGYEWDYDYDWTNSVVVLDPTDYKVHHNGRTLERLASGLNARGWWASQVQVDYVPVNDNNTRQEIAIKLVQLDLRYNGTNGTTVGDVRESPLTYATERRRLLKVAQPRAFYVS